MKILCVSDQIDPLVYSNLAKERFSDVGCILCAGDLPSDYIDFIVSTLNKPAFFIFGNHNLTEYSYYHKQKKHHNGAHPTTFQEHDYYDMGGSFGATYAGFKNLRDRHVIITDPDTGKKRPLLITGVSGSKRYNKGLNQFTDFEMKLQLLKLVPGLLWNKLRWGKYADIFLTHATPRHIHDKEDPCHQGFECFNSFIKYFGPSYMIHGHIHLYDANAERITEVETKLQRKTIVINAYSHFILNLYSDQIEGNANA